MDVLRQATDGELDFIVEKLKANLPHSIKDVHYIFGMRRIQRIKGNYVDLSTKVLPIFYVPRSGDLENCTLFAITGEDDHVVWFISMRDDLKELRECLFQTKLIKWNDVVLFMTLHREHVQTVFEFCQLNKVPLQSDDEASYYWLPKEKALLIEVEPPTGTYLRELTKRDAKICTKNWIYASINSERYVESLIQLNGGYGLFTEENDDILCFAIFNEQLAIGMLTTLDEDSNGSKKGKRKGYGELIAKFCSRKCVEKFDIPPVVFINCTNEISTNLFIGKLGYEKIAESNWIVVGNKNY